MAEHDKIKIDELEDEIKTLNEIVNLRNRRIATLEQDLKKQQEKYTKLNEWNKSICLGIFKDKLKGMIKR